MTTEEMSELFEKYSNTHYLVRGEENLRDLDAFIRLQKLAPVDGDIISASEHDQFWLAHDEGKVAEAAIEEDVIYLVRCGVLYDEGEGFSFFA